MLSSETCSPGCRIPDSVSAVNVSFILESAPHAAPSFTSDSASHAAPSFISDSSSHAGVSAMSVSSSHAGVSMFPDSALHTDVFMKSGFSPSAAGIQISPEFALIVTVICPFCAVTDVPASPPIKCSPPSADIVMVKSLSSLFTVTRTFSPFHSLANAYCRFVSRSSLYAPYESAFTDCRIRPSAAISLVIGFVLTASL